MAKDKEDDNLLTKEIQSWDKFKYALREQSLQNRQPSSLSLLLSESKLETILLLVAVMVFFFFPLLLFEFTANNLNANIILSFALCAVMISITPPMIILH
jgi:hypothetical protein